MSKAEGTSPSDELRKAAEHIREVLKVADDGPWSWDDYRAQIRNEAGTVVDIWAGNVNGKHIALWDPTAALPVAEWLESEADDADREAADSIYGAAGQDFVYAAGDPHPALKLARAINERGAS